MLPLIIGGIVGLVGGGIALLSGKKEEEERKKAEAEVEERRRQEAEERRRQEEEERRRREAEERRRREAEEKRIKVRNIVKISSDAKKFWRKDEPEATYTITKKMRQEAWEVINITPATAVIREISPRRDEIVIGINGLYKINMSKEKIMAQMNSGYKFTALGLSGSGKTCFMAGMYYKMAGGLEGYTLKADDDDAVKLETYYRQMTNTNAGMDRFPGGTNQSTEYGFELQYGYKTIERFKWVDYAGGTLKSKNTGDAEEYSKLKEDISDSEVLYIFVDGGLFQDEEVADASGDKEKTEILADIVKDECSNEINHFISEYTNERNNLPPIMIVVTKYDLVGKALGKATNEETLKILNDVIKKAFNPLFPNPSAYSSDEGYTRMVGVIPVSLGYKISEDDYKGKLRPINMHLPAYIGIWFMLKSQGTQNSFVRMLGDEIEDSKVEFWLNGKSGKFATLAEGYLEKVKGR